MKRLRQRLHPAILTLLLCVAPLAAQTAADATLTVSGDVPMPLTLKGSDLTAMDRQRVELPEANGQKTVYEGVPLQAILQKAGIQFGRQLRGKALAGYVIAEGKDGYEVVFGLGELDPELGGTRILVADTLNGGPLNPDQGPLRLVLPGDKEGCGCWKSWKW